MRRLLLLFILLIAAPAAAQPREPEWRQAVEEQVLVEIGAYQPNPLRLVAGQPTRLVFYNSSRARLSIQAGSFFGNAYIRRGDERLVQAGGMVLNPGETRSITLVPTAGRYSMRSRSWLRRFTGMRGSIIVEPPGTRQRAAGELVDR